MKLKLNSHAPNLQVCKYTLRQKFSIMICVKEGKDIWLELIPVNKYFDTIVPIRHVRCHLCLGHTSNYIRCG